METLCINICRVRGGFKDWSNIMHIYTMGQFAAVSACLTSHTFVSFAYMERTFWSHVRRPKRMVRSFINFRLSPFPWRGGNRRTKGSRSYAQFFSTICVFSAIVPSCIICLKRAHKFLCTVRYERFVMYRSSACHLICNKPKLRHDSFFNLGSYKTQTFYIIIYNRRCWIVQLSNLFRVVWA